MKKLINKLKKRSELIIGLVVGTIVTSCICYGVNNIQSSSVSYTKDGKTMSVKQAIDDLIVKVNEKRNGVLSNITLTEKEITTISPITTNTLKGYLDAVLTGMINVGNYDTKELTTMKNATYTWTSKDISIVEISGTTVAAKRSGTTEIVGTNDMGLQVIIPIIAKNVAYLADKVSIGDYVTYDAGVWTSSAAIPTSQGQFGGYTKGQNKANSVSTCHSGTVTLKGWRVLSIDTNTKTVTIVHAGQPECYYHVIEGNDVSIINLNNRAISEYLNSDYASSAHMMNKSEANQTSTYISGIKTIGDFYFLATASNSQRLEGVSSTGNSHSLYNTSSGVRPVVVLKSNILTTGKGTDMVGQEAWALVKP